MLHPLSSHIASVGGFALPFRRRGVARCKTNSDSGRPFSRLGERRVAGPGQHMPGAFGPLYTHEERVSMINDK